MEIGSWWHRQRSNAHSWTQQLFIFLKEINIYKTQLYYNVCTVEKGGRDATKVSNAACSLCWWSSLQWCVKNVERLPFSMPSESPTDSETGFKKGGPKGRALTLFFHMHIPIAAAGPRARLFIHPWSSTLHLNLLTRSKCFNLFYVAFCLLIHSFLSPAITK